VLEEVQVPRDFSPEVASGADVDALVVLEKKGGRNHVRESYEIKGEEVV
jgi:hypothetical protein